MQNISKRKSAFREGLRHTGPAAFALAFAALGFTSGARSMGAGRWHVLRYVLLAELYVFAAGIGYLTTAFTQDFNPTKLFGLVSALAVMAVALNETEHRAEIRFSRWRD